MAELILKEEAYLITGICMDIHNNLGHGFLEVVYKDALEYELKLKDIYYERECEFDIQYKNTILPHRFFADFVVMNKIILEIKAKDSIANEDIAQAINYVKVSGCKLCLLVNFGRTKLEVKELFIEL